MLIPGGGHKLSALGDEHDFGASGEGGAGTSREEGKPIVMSTPAPPTLSPTKKLCMEVGQLGSELHLNRTEMKLFRRSALVPWRGKGSVESVSNPHLGDAFRSWLHNVQGEKGRGRIGSKNRLIPSATLTTSVGGNHPKMPTLFAYSPSSLAPLKTD